MMCVVVVETMIVIVLAVLGNSVVCIVHSPTDCGHMNHNSDIELVLHVRAICPGCVQFAQNTCGAVCCVDRCGHRCR